MKKQDFFYLFISLALLALSGYVYMTYGNSHQVPASKEPAKVVVKQVDQQAELVASLTKKLDELEKKPNADALAALKPELDKLKASTQRDALMSRFEKLSAELVRIAEAEAAIKATTENLTQANLVHAQELIDQIQTSSKKDELQARLDSLAAELAAATPASSSSSTATEEAEVEAEVLTDTNDDTYIEATVPVVPASTYTPVEQPTAPVTTPSSQPVEEPTPPSSAPADPVVDSSSDASAPSTSGEGN